MPSKTNLSLKYLVLVAVLAFGAWLHFELAAIVLIAYVVAALLFDFQSNVSLVAGLFLLTANIILPHMNPNLAATDANIGDLRVYGLILVIFWLAIIVDRKVNVFVAGKDGLGQPVRIAVGGGAGSAISGIRLFLKRTRRMIFGGAIAFFRENIRKMKKTPGLAGRLLIIWKILAKLPVLSSKKLWQILSVAAKKIIRAMIFVGRTTSRFLRLAVKKISLFSRKAVKWAWRIFIGFWQSLFRFVITSSKSRNSIFKAIGLIIVFFILGYYTTLAFLEILTWMFFLAALLFRWDSRIAIGIALALLLACPFLLSWKSQSLAERVAEMVAVYAYYFLVIGVILQIIEYAKEGRRKKKVSGEKPFSAA